MNKLNRPSFSLATELSALGLNEAAISMLDADKPTNILGLLALRGGLTDGSRAAIGVKPNTPEPLRHETAYGIGIQAATILIDGERA